MLIGLFSLMVAGYSGYGILALQDPSFSSEESVLEWSQAVLIFIAMIVYMVVGLAQKNPARMIALFFAVLCYSFILREVDFDKMNLPDAAVFMLYGGGRYVTLALGFGITLGCAALNWKRYFLAAWNFVFSKEGLLIALAAAFLWLGYFFEHKFDVANDEFWEEFCELLGYACLLSSALFSLMHTRKGDGGELQESAPTA